MAARLTEREWPHHEYGRFVERGGIRWHVTVMGEGPVMLLVHGTGASSHSFRDLMPLLAERYTVIAPDLPGHALSRAPSWFEPSLSVTSAALEELLEALDVHPTIAVGHSAGAAIIAQMTLDDGMHPELLVGLGAALVPFRGVARALFPPTARLLSTASKLVALRMGSTESVERMLRRTGSSLDARGVELYRRLSETPSHVAAVLAMMASWDPEPLFEALPQLEVPFLLLAAADDRAIPLAQQRAVAARLPKGRVVVVPAVGHLLHEEQPALVARLIQEEAERGTR